MGQTKHSRAVQGPEGGTIVTPLAEAACSPRTHPMLCVLRGPGALPGQSLRPQVAQGALDTGPAQALPVATPNPG